MASQLGELEGRAGPAYFATADPVGANLGSGGATAHVLVAAWQATGGGEPFGQWLQKSRKLIIHGGGQSRSLPAYAAVGKPFIPVPVFRGSRGQRFDQALIDLQLADCRRILRRAPASLAVLVASGDVLLRFGHRLPEFPAVDVLALGMPVAAEQAQHFGVFFVARGRCGSLSFVLQKPSAARIHELSVDYLPLVDTGMWLLSERAVHLLLQRSGWDEPAATRDPWNPQHYELYGRFGLALGTTPVELDPEVNALSCAVVALPDPEFYHLGTSRQLVESLSALQNRMADRTATGFVASGRHPDQFAQNARVGFPLRPAVNPTLWIENSVVPATWQLAKRHILTGVPENSWNLELEAGVCLDFAPVGPDRFCIRAYGMDDSFEGSIGDNAACWLGQSVGQWFAARGVDPAQAGCPVGMDMFEAPLFPVLPLTELEPRFLRWLFAARPERSSELARRWIAVDRLSARELTQRINLCRLYAQRATYRQACLGPLVRHRQRSVFHRLDLEATARGLPPEAMAALDEVALGGGAADAMLEVRDQMVRAAVLRCRGDGDWQEKERAAFARLRELIEREAQLASVRPRCRVHEDQIVWGRSPVRLDLAGGWTDTPPYCLENGGRVVNLAADLNGQPPVQVFARLSERPEFVIRSIDLGVEQRVNSYEALETFAQPGSEFALAKAALALAGFLPRFHAAGGYRTLQEQLDDFGGGIEISLLAAVPKGSGLGTSSILAATLLATLSDLCGLEWDRHVLFSRTLALEQMVTTGGGWQDQAGGIFRGVKLIETTPGLVQQPTLRWLPNQLFDEEYANNTVLLYYTGLTRLAKGILHEVVRGVFLNSPEHLVTLEEIAANADTAFAVIQRADYAGLAEVVRTSWDLNQRLDVGTNPPEIQRLLGSVSDYLGGCKLLGAGGGGYLLMLAKDADAAARIRRVLKDNPPNAKARMVSFALSNTGLQVTRS